MKISPNIFKKAEKGSSNIFRKAGGVADDVFKKASGAVKMVREQGPAIAEQISKGAGQAQNVLGQVAKVSGKIAANPITQTLPFGSTIAAGAGALSGAARLGAKGAGQISDISNPDKYKTVRGQGSALENIRDVRRRGEEIAQTGREMGSVFM